MKRILFVDDEAKILDGLRRSLHNLRGQWEMMFAEGGLAALKECASRPFDVVVSDARMPGMEGAEFLGKIRKFCPDTVRMILSGQCSRNSVLKCVGVAHQFLTKPCELGTLKAAVQRVCRIRDSFHDEPTREAIGSVQWLPSQARVYQEFADQVVSPMVSIEHVAEIVARDVGISAKVVQLVSSGFFGTPQRISSAAHAAKLLGLETLKATFASPSAFQPCFEVGWEEDLHLLAAHSFAVAEVAKAIAETLTDDRMLIGDAYLAGTLHEVGRLALTGCNAPCRAGADATGIVPSPGHGAGPSGEEPDPGGYLTALWGLSDPVVQAIAYHRIPRRCLEQPSVPLTAVHVANVLLEHADDAGGEAIGSLDMAYLQTNGWAAHLDNWREKCRECQPEGIRQ